MHKLWPFELPDVDDLRWDDKGTINEDKIVISNGPVTVVILGIRCAIFVDDINLHDCGTNLVSKDYDSYVWAVQENMRKRRQDQWKERVFQKLADHNKS